MTAEVGCAQGIRSIDFLFLLARSLYVSFHSIFSPCPATGSCGCPCISKPASLHAIIPIHSLYSWRRNCSKCVGSSAAQLLSQNGVVLSVNLFSHYSDYHYQVPDMWFVSGEPHVQNIEQFDVKPKIGPLKSLWQFSCG